MSSVRVRFAPSPTGYLHIGSLRTALFNWLYARHHQGTFLVRIEDTDRERSTSEFEESILKSLAWVGIQPDEPIVYQFARLELHKFVVQKLLDQGKAYKCYCSEEMLQEKKEKVMSKQQTYQYDKLCRALSPSHVQQDSYVVRFKVVIPEETFSFVDAIKGEISVPSEQIDDFIILRSDDTVVYNFAVVQDDHDMNITHVIRGEDHLLNTVKQILLYQALGYPVPVFAHIPLILGESGQKLSKRDAVTSVVEYKKDGYLPEALCNYLVRLGWSYGDQELFSVEEMVQHFSLEGVHLNGAKFDVEKLLWMNAHYIKKSSSELLLELMQKNLPKDITQATFQWTDENRYKWIELYKDRVSTLQELYAALVQAYTVPASYDWEELYTIVPKDSIVMLQLLQLELEPVEFTKDNVMKLVKAFCRSHEYKMATITQLLRFSLLGTISGPGVFDIMILYGKQEVRKRLSHIISLL